VKGIASMQISAVVRIGARPHGSCIIAAGEAALALNGRIICNTFLQRL
jgi:hypothetical protein